MTTSNTPQGKTLFGHPVGLYVLFFTEMWERFSYYGMRGILVLFLVSKTKGGLGWTEPEALSLYGWYTMLVYLMSIPGGFIADRFLGQRRAVMLGGSLLVAGHLLMTITTLWAFYSALLLIIFGVGLLKPNISTMVGGLYKNRPNQRETGFIIFYIGINLGAFLASVLVGYIGEQVGWHYGFGLAGIGMILGQAVFIFGQKHLADVGNFQGSASTSGPKRPKQPLTRAEKSRLKVIGLSFLVVMIFWASFEQAGGLMNLYTKHYTDRLITDELLVDEYQIAGRGAADSIAAVEVATLVSQKAERPIHSFGDLMTNLFSPQPRSIQEIRAQIETLNLGGIALAPKLTTRTYTVPKASADSALYAALTGEDRLAAATATGYKIYDLNNAQPGFEIPASWFQALNPLFILLFGGAFAALWSYLAKRRREPTAMTKFGLGTILLGTGFLLMVFAAMQQGQSDLGKSSAWWLIGAYLLHTVGELCISPIALSFITRLAPERIVATVMGVYFAVTGIANKIAAEIGESATELGE
ncbi:MAG: peptide MFS transporter, partial [Bacteroidota bacterium]